MLLTAYVMRSRVLLPKQLICQKNKFYSKLVETNPGDINKIQKCIGQPTHYSHPHLIKEDEITPLIKKDEYRKRRQNLMDRINEFSRNQMNSMKNFVVILPSASKKYMSDKIPYFFRQNTEFLYLTGCQEPDSCLVLTSQGSEHYSSLLFVQGTDVHSELWDGPRICPSKVEHHFGIEKGLPMEEFENYLQLFLKSNPGVVMWYDLFSNVQDNVDNVIKNLLKVGANNMLQSPKFFVDQQRLIKSPSEIELMRKSCEIASKAIVSTIQSSHPGNNEYEIFAKVDYECRMKGAEYLAYPPVIAGGKRANIIHYITNNQVVNDDEMVLMDVGCEYHGYSSDITRTWPIGGKFTNEQKELYQAVLETQSQVIDLCKNFCSLDSLFDSMCKILGKKLQQIGLIPKSISDNALVKYAYKFCPHHVSHYLGMDVHDTPTVTRNIPVKPGMIITIEPGVYIPENNESVPRNYRGLGIRIEDDILITENGPEILTKYCPKDVADVEEIASTQLQ